MMGCINRGRTDILKETVILSKTPATQQQAEAVKSILPPSFADRLSSDCQLFKCVIINPNVELSYALVSPASQLVWALDYDPLLNPSGRYLEASTCYPLSSAWKSALLEQLNCSYHIPC